MRHLVRLGHREVGLQMMLDEADRAWFLEAGYVEAPKSRAIRAEVGALCRELREHARVLVDGWGIPEGVLGAVDVVGAG